MGAGAAKRLSAVRWGVAGNIVVAWVLTLPCSAAVGALTYGVVRLFGDRHGRAGRGDVPVRRHAGARVRPAGRGAARRRDACSPSRSRSWPRSSGSRLLAGIGITTTYSVAVLGAGRSAEATRTGRRVAALAYAALAVAFLLVFVGGLIWGVVIMLAK